MSEFVRGVQVEGVRANACCGFLSFHHVKVNSLGGGTWGDNFPFAFVLMVEKKFEMPGLLAHNCQSNFFFEGIRKDSFDSNVTKQQLI
jgi:hypothetical protein